MKIYSHTMLRKIVGVDVTELMAESHAWVVLNCVQRVYICQYCSAYREEISLPLSNTFFHDTILT